MSVLRRETACLDPRRDHATTERPDRLSADDLCGAEARKTWDCETGRKNHQGTGCGFIEGNRGEHMLFFYNESRG